MRASRTRLLCYRAVLKEVSANIRRHRNKRITHLDLRTSTAVDDSWLPRITWGELEDAVELLKDLVLDICRASGEPTPDYDPIMPAARDGRKLIKVLKAGHEALDRDI